MISARDPLPSMDGAFFITDGGLETSLIFLEGLELPCFASFPLLLDDAGRARLEQYFEPYIRTALEKQIGFILDTPTWRANADWGAKLGYSPDDIVAINRRAVTWAKDMRRRYATNKTPIVISGVLGPRGDGYRPDEQMSADEAHGYHSAQIRVFKETGADVASAMTINYVNEAIGLARVAHDHELPLVISFTVETDGRLISGETLRTAIEKVDDETDGGPDYYMINCAHPTHFEGALMSGGDWTLRIRGVRANASRLSHAELDEAENLDSGDPVDLGRRYRAMRDHLKHLRVLGGCCGTDSRHIRAICDACLPVSG